jgi:glycosyltransferase involved in cell wall biosynthesis
MIRRLGALLGRERIPLRARPIASLESDQAAPGDAVRWLGALAIAGETREALFAHPTSQVTYSWRARRGDVVAADCALLPDVWPKNTGGVAFTIAVTALTTGATASATLVLDPGRQPGDRRWRPLRVAIPIEGDDEVSIAFATRVPEGAAPDHAWASWGDPRVERPHSRTEVTRALAAFLRTALRHGPRAAARELQASALLDERTAAYRRWAQAHTPDPPALAAMAAESARFARRPLISIITPVYNTDPRWLRACIASVAAQAYPNWELCLCDDGSTSEATRAVLRGQTDPRLHVTFLEKNAGISTASNAALALARGDYVALLDHDDELTPDALYHVVTHLNAAPDTDVVYSDEDKRDADGGLSDPFFKPCWSPEHLLSAMYTCHLTVARKSLVDRIGGFRIGYEGSQDHDLMLRLSEVTTRIDHLPHILYHWRRTPESTASDGSVKRWATDAGTRALEDYLRRNAIDGEVVSGGVPGLYRTRFAIAGHPLVTIVVVAENATEAALADAVAAIRAQTRYAPVEVVTAAAATAALTREVNAAIRATTGAHIVVIDAALRPLDDEWLAALLEYSQQEAIGAAGGKIQYADGRLRHIGIVTCVAGGPAHIFEGYPGESYGYFSSSIGVRNYAALSGECLMTRRDVFERLGGFDERWAWRDADIDYGARARAAGLRLVFTPYARFRWTGPAGPPRRTTTVRDDPYYNRNLSRVSADYRLDG